MDFADKIPIYPVNQRVLCAGQIITLGMDFYCFAGQKSDLPR